MSGIVVEHKETGVKYAVSLHNFNPKVHTKVRDLKPGETVHGFKPRAKAQRPNTTTNTAPCTDGASETSK